MTYPRGEVIVDVGNGLGPGPPRQQSPARAPVAMNIHAAGSREHDKSWLRAPALSPKAVHNMRCECAM